MKMKMLHQKNEPVHQADAAGSLPEARIQVTWEVRLDMIDRLEPEWRHLEARVSDRTVFATWDYINLWYRHYSGIYGTPLVGIARRDGELVGVAALVMHKSMFGGIPVRRVDYAGYDGQSGEFLVADNCPEAVGELITSFLQTIKWDLACFGNLPPGSSHLISLERAVKASGIQYQCQDHAYAMVDLRDGADAYWNKLDGKIRRNLKRVFSRAKAAGETAVNGLRFFEHTSGNCEAVLKRAIDLTNASQKMRDVGRHLPAHHQNFYQELEGRFGSKSMIDVAILKIAGEDAAYLMALVERGIYYDVTVSFAKKFKNVFPGIFLMHELLRQLPDKGIHTVVSHGAYEYKRNWATSFVPAMTAYLLNRGFRMRLAYFGHFVLAPWVRRMLRRAPG